MAGHSKWANIPAPQERQDKRQRIWTRDAEIMVATRLGGGDMQTNAAPGR
jgi:transcriptional/translational regulatory protein YebC/TACO1